MIDAATVADRTPLPAPPEGWFDYRYAALLDGRLALVRTSIDFHDAWQRWSASLQPGVIRSTRPTPAPSLRGASLRLSIFDGVAETDALVVPSPAFPIVDRMPDGRWLVASTRTRSAEANARFIEPDGTESTAFYLGDAIEHLLCSPQGTIWVGYFDEGALSDGRPQTGGIVHFDSKGDVIWSFNDHKREQRNPSGSPASPPFAVEDCYAMTLSSDGLWACYYSSFPIARITGDHVTLWSNAVAGAKAIATEGNIAILAGGYSEDAGRISITELGNNTSRERGRLRFEPLTTKGAGLVQGRDGVLHIVGGGVWFRTRVGQAVQALG